MNSKKERLLTLFNTLMTVLFEDRLADTQPFGHITWPLITAIWHYINSNDENGLKTQLGSGAHLFQAAGLHIKINPTAGSDHPRVTKKMSITDIDLLVDTFEKFPSLCAVLDCLRYHLPPLSTTTAPETHEGKVPLERFQEGQVPLEPHSDQKAIFCMFVSFSARLSVCRRVCLSVYLPVCPLVYLSSKSSP